MTKNEHQLSHIISEIIKASVNIDLRIFEQWWSKKYFRKIAPKGNNFFNKWLLCNSIAFYMSTVSYSAYRRNFLQCAQLHKFPNVPNMYKIYTSRLILFDSINYETWNSLTIYTFQTHGFSRIISPVHLKYCLPRWDMVSPTLTKNEIFSSKININNYLCFAGFLWRYTIYYDYMHEII